MSIDVKALPEDPDIETTEEDCKITVVRALPQKTLAQCIEWIENHIDPALRRKIEVMDKVGPHGLATLHDTLGLDICFGCDLSSAGTDEVVTDIRRLRDGGLTITVFDHFNLTYDRAWLSDTGTIFSVFHPENASGVILDVYQELINGNIGLSLIERKD